MNPAGEGRKNGPVEAARAMRGRRGFAFLDSAMAGPGAVSILACEPDLVLRGRDWTALEEELKRRSRGRDGGGIPTGAAIGRVDYDGEFCFGFHEKLHVFVHDERRWINPPENFELPSESAEPLCIGFQPRVGREVFLEMVRRAKEWIAAGDIYQVCLSHPFEAGASGRAWDFHEALRRCSPAPFAAYLDEGERQIVSASPESFLEMRGRLIRTRPIKGTRPRRSDPHNDQRSSRELLSSDKEIAELVMITDLERNDLGQVCDYGTVVVPGLCELEAYQQVFHLVSTVEGRLRSGVSHVEALRACFPGGSISGAPKKRAMEIIADLEPFPRGLYTGAIGYFGFNGGSHFSMAIRTAVFERERSHFHVGAGIVADSDPESEWLETWHKAAGLLMAAGAEAEAD
ncbi:MAG: anthranilate synthase component I family protein [Verrucomicrobiota bacterium]